MTFDDCSLSGVLFRDCTFKGTSGVAITNGNVSQITFERVDATKVEFVSVFGNCITFTDLRAGEWKIEQATLRNVLFERWDRPSAGGQADVLVTRSLLAHWHIDAGAVGQMHVQESVALFCSADPTTEKGWVTFTDCEQVGSMIPPPALGAVHEMTDHGGPALDQERPQLARRPLGPAVDPWTAGRDPAF